MVSIKKNKILIRFFEWLCFPSLRVGDVTVYRKIIKIKSFNTFLVSENYGPKNLRVEYRRYTASPIWGICMLRYFLWRICKFLKGEYANGRRVGCGPTDCSSNLHSPSTYQGGYNVDNSEGRFKNTCF